MTKTLRHRANKGTIRSGIPHQAVTPKTCFWSFPANSGLTPVIFRGDNYFGLISFCQSPSSNPRKTLAFGALQ